MNANPNLRAVPCTRHCLINKQHIEKWQIEEKLLSPAKTCSQIDAGLKWKRPWLSRIPFLIVKIYIRISLKKTRKKLFTFYNIFAGQRFGIHNSSSYSKWQYHPEKSICCSFPIVAIATKWAWLFSHFCFTRTRLIISKKNKIPFVRICLLIYFHFINYDST